MPTRCSRCAVPRATLSLSSTRRIPLTTSTSAWVIQPGEATVTTGPSPSSTVVTRAVARSSTWQFCHVEDLATALVTTVELGLGPVVTVASPGWMTQSEVEVVSGMRRVELSESVALGTAQRLHRVGILPSPATDLAYAVYPWAVSSATLGAAGWQAAYDNETCLGVLLESIRGHHAVAARRLDRKDAALGAASAAVALVGTAAMMRRHRRKGGGA